MIDVSETEACATILTKDLKGYETSIIIKKEKVSTEMKKFQRENIILVAEIKNKRNGIDFVNNKNKTNARKVCKMK